MKIKKIKKVTPRSVYAVKTSTGTFIADGVAHHNCYGCNGPRAKDGVVTVQYTNFMTDFYGREFVDELLVMKNITKKYTRDEIADISKGFKEQIKDIESRL